MQYTVKSTILGFEQVECVELYEIDELFSTLKSCDGSVSFTLVSPYVLREYSFDLPSTIRVLLDINENSKVVVYNIAVIQDPLQQSFFNFLTPLIFNQNNSTMSQAKKKKKNHPGFGLAEPIKHFKAV